jgi:hypothetical protein
MEIDACTTQKRYHNALYMFSHSSHCPYKLIGFAGLCCFARMKDNLFFLFVK